MTKKNKQDIKMRKYIFTVMVGVIFVLGAIFWLINRENRLVSTTESPHVYKARYKVIGKNVSDINAPLYKIVVSEGSALPLPEGVSFYFGPNSEEYGIDEKTNSKDVIVKSASKLPIGKEYKNANYSLTVVSENPDLEGYLDDKTYYRVNTDCKYDYTFCIKSINNGYQPYAIFGCGGPPEHEGLTDKEKAVCPKKKWIDNEQYSTAGIQYSKIECVKNRCQGVGRKVVCAKP